MVFYTLYGWIFPRWLDFFYHPGASFYRVVTSSTVEFSTGIYGVYGQLALTLIAAFLLLAGVANGFNAQNSMINVVRLVARSRRLIPQTAVLGSSAIGLISGSGSANAAVVGTVTIPLMMRYGVPGTFAAAVETAASMGGLIDPPMMGAAAFLMAEFLGVPYWDVVIRGFALAFVYYISISVAVYLLCVRLLPGDTIDRPQVPLYDKVTTAIFFASVLYLVYLMGFVGMGELLAALYTATFMLVPLILVFLYFKHVVKEPQLKHETLFGSFRRGIETHAEMTSYLTLLLATLGIMIGLFTVTGFIVRMGGMLIELGAWNIVAMILMAFVFGWLAGTGLPPTATYIIGAVVIVPPLVKLGINPWVAHFFVFLLSVWGELSPPTSLTAAVSSRIANASFMRTMWEALKICSPITLMTFAIFTRFNMVTNPGWLMIADTLLVLISTLGITFAMFGRCHVNRAVDIALRCLLAARWRCSRCSIPTCRRRLQPAWRWRSRSSPASGGTARSPRRRIRRSTLASAPVPGNLGTARHRGAARHRITKRAARRAARRMQRPPYESPTSPRRGSQSRWRGSPACRPASAVRRDLRSAAARPTRRGGLRRRCQPRRWHADAGPARLLNSCEQGCAAPTPPPANASAAPAVSFKAAFNRAICPAVTVGPCSRRPCIFSACKVLRQAKVRSCRREHCARERCFPHPDLQCLLIVQCRIGEI